MPSIPGPASRIAFPSYTTGSMLIKEETAVHVFGAWLRTCRIRRLQKDQYRIKRLVLHLKRSLGQDEEVLVGASL